MLLCSLLSFILSELTSKFWLFPIATCMQIVLFLYSKYLKKSLFLGNIVVAHLLAMPYFLIAYVFQFFNQDRVIVLVLFTLAFSAILLNFIREIAKDWEDVKGDALIGAKTFAIRYGEENTKDLLQGIFIFSMIGHGFLLLLWSYFNQVNTIIVTWPLLLVALLHLPFIFGLASKGWTARLLSQRLKVLMFIGVLWVYYLWVYAKITCCTTL